MPIRLRSFRTRVERRIVLLVFVFCLVPLVGLTWGAVQLIEAQTLEVSRRHLSEYSKDFALDLLLRLEVAAWELRHAAAQAEDATPAVTNWRWVEPRGTERNSANLQRPALLDVAGGFELRVPVGTEVRRGFISDGELFSDLDHVPFGVYGCVLVAGVERRCAGERPAAQPITASWTLPLASVYASDSAIEVRTSQPRDIALANVGLSYRLLPHAVLALMTMAGWFVMTRIRSKFAPISELERATARVARGEFGHRVVLHSGDEFERLGDAFNSMTGRLSRSFETMRALSAMDRMILDDAALDDLIREALRLMRSLYQQGAVLWLWEPGSGSGSGHRYRLGAGARLEQEPGGSGAIPSSTAQAARVLRSGVMDGVAETRSIMRENRLVGVLASEQADLPSELPTGQTDDVMGEIADRLSVAVTLHHRARVLYRQANYDGLTGLLNRQAFGDHLEKAVENTARDHARGALLCLDLDRFKQINDTEGHHVGDRLLSQIARRLRAGLRATDEAARLGGDEFSVLVPRVSDVAEIQALCRRLMDDVGQPVDIDGSQLVVDVSIGAVMFPDDGDDAEALMRKADMAMYKAKELSGSSLAFFDEVMNRETEQRTRVETRLRRGLGERQLCLHFQPKIRLTDGAVVGVEGLLRWPAERDMHPTIFIPVAEQTGLIHDFNDILVEDGKACIDACRSRGFDIERVAINVSPKQFQRDGFAGRLLDKLEACNADPGTFEIEVTESLFVHDRDAVARSLERLRDAGVTIALDDFGTGYSSLNLLRELPLDVIKIDHSFVSPITDSPEALDLVGRIIEIVRALSLRSVAEGVETARELELLSAKGCDLVQGFLFSPALPIAGLMDFLEGRCAKSA